MYVIPELHLNDFELVRIPSPKELFRKFGASLAQPSGSSDLDEPSNRYDSLNKFDAIATAQHMRISDAQSAENQQDMPADV